MGLGHCRGFSLRMNNATEKRLNLLTSAADVEKDRGDLEYLSTNVKAHDKAARLIEGKGKRDSCHGVHLNGIKYEIVGTKYELHFQICAAWKPHNSFLLVQVMKKKGDGKGLKVMSTLSYRPENAEKFDLEKQHRKYGSITSAKDDPDSQFLVNIESIEQSGAFEGMWDIDIKLYHADPDY